MATRLPAAQAIDVTAPDRPVESAVRPGVVDVVARVAAAAFVADPAGVRLDVPALGANRRRSSRRRADGRRAARRAAREMPTPAATVALRQRRRRVERQE